MKIGQKLKYTYHEEKIISGEFMDPQLCRTLNHLSLEQLASYLNVEIKKIEGYYSELLNDK